MKAKAFIFTGVALSLLGLAAPLQLRADNMASNVDTAGQYSPPPNQPPPPVDRASNLIGMKVKNPAHQTLGTVKDVVFDLQTGRISYVVVEKAGRTHGTGAYAAVPPSAFTPSADMKHLILNTDKIRLQNSQGFSRNNYPPLGEPAFGAQPGGQQQQEIIVVPVLPATPDQNQMPDSDKDQNQDSNSDQGTHSTPGPDSDHP